MDQTCGATNGLVQREFRFLARKQRPLHLGLGVRFANGRSNSHTKETAKEKVRRCCRDKHHHLPYKPVGFQGFRYSVVEKTILDARFCVETNAHGGRTDRKIARRWGWDELDREDYRLSFSSFDRRG
jgi:hypothetical protein